MLLIALVFSTLTVTEAVKVHDFDEEDHFGNEDCNAQGECEALDKLRAVINGECGCYEVKDFKTAATAAASATKTAYTESQDGSKNDHHFNEAKEVRAANQALRDQVNQATLSQAKHDYTVANKLERANTQLGRVNDHQSELMHDKTLVDVTNALATKLKDDNMPKGPERAARNAEKWYTNQVERVNRKVSQFTADAEADATAQTAKLAAKTNARNQARADFAAAHPQPEEGATE